jgi:hypothetical protein
VSQAVRQALDLAPPSVRQPRLSVTRGRGPSYFGAEPPPRTALTRALTLLSPYREQLEALAAKWDDDSLGSWDEEPQS